MAETLSRPPVGLDSPAIIDPFNESQPGLVSVSDIYQRPVGCKLSPFPADEFDVPLPIYVPPGHVSKGKPNKHTTSGAAL